MTPRTLIRALAGGCAILASVSCKEGGSGPPEIGPPAELVLLTTSGVAAPANTLVPVAIKVQVQDANNKPVPNQIVTFSTIDGGGILDAFADTSDANGTVTVPPWRLGKLAVAQTVRATLGALPPLNISAVVTTFYRIDVRFFGTSMTAQQQALFTNAARRIEGFVTGDVIDAQATNVDIATPCNMPGQPQMNELIDDVVIFASIQDIDGQGKILAQAGPCLYRDVAPAGSAVKQFMPAVGTMQFDAADINTLTGGGSLQEVITHEMLHVLGFGVLWRDRQLLAGDGTSDPRFTGAQARQGCQAASGTVTCAATVPVEGTGGTGTANSHWRESTFDTELMTGFIDQSPNPLSVMTIGSIADIGYTVNNADGDAYTIPGGSLRAGTSSLIQRTDWERSLPVTYFLVLEKNGTARRVNKK
jgi:hypothetical protein